MQIKNFVFSPFQENTYVVWDETKDCIIIDAGNFFENEHKQLDAFLKENNLNLVYIVNTHNHLDHIFGTPYLVGKYNVPVACHPDDLFWIERFKTTCEGYGLPADVEAPVPTIMLNDGDVFEFGCTKLKVIHVPGHSPGGIALYNEEHDVAFVGDILFNGSIGRTDLPGGVHEDLINGISQKLLVLPEHTRVLTGHGAETSIGLEKESNPFLR
jgi:glyoxylase-like metal-dependent hydrolase (beta-lactamase superfamily II)